MTAQQGQQGAVARQVEVALGGAQVLIWSGFGAPRPRGRGYGGLGDGHGASASFGVATGCPSVRRTSPVRKPSP